MGTLAAVASRRALVARRAGAGSPLGRSVVEEAAQAARVRASVEKILKEESFGAPPPARMVRSLRRRSEEPLEPIAGGGVNVTVRVGEGGTIITNLAISSHSTKDWTLIVSDPEGDSRATNFYAEARAELGGPRTVMAGDLLATVEADCRYTHELPASCGAEPPVLIGGNRDYMLLRFLVKEKRQLPRKDDSPEDAQKAIRQLPYDAGGGAGWKHVIEADNAAPGEIQPAEKKNDSDAMNADGPADDAVDQSKGLLKQWAEKMSCSCKCDQAEEVRARVVFAKFFFLAEETMGSGWIAHHKVGGGLVGHVISLVTNELHQGRLVKCADAILEVVANQRTALKAEETLQEEALETQIKNNPAYAEQLKGKKEAMKYRNKVRSTVFTLVACNNVVVDRTSDTSECKGETYIAFVNALEEFLCVAEETIGSTKLVDCQMSSDKEFRVVVVHATMKVPLKTDGDAESILFHFPTRVETKASGEVWIQWNDYSDKYGKRESDDRLCRWADDLNRWIKELIIAAIHGNQCHNNLSVDGGKADEVNLEADEVALLVMSLAGVRNSCASIVDQRPKPIDNNDALGGTPTYLGLGHVPSHFARMTVNSSGTLSVAGRADTQYFRPSLAGQLVVPNTDGDKEVAKAQLDAFLCKRNPPPVSAFCRPRSDGAEPRLYAQPEKPTQTIVDGVEKRRLEWARGGGYTVNGPEVFIDGLPYTAFAEVKGGQVKYVFFGDPTQEMSKQINAASKRMKSAPFAVLLFGELYDAASQTTLPYVYSDASVELSTAPLPSSA